MTTTCCVKVKEAQIEQKWVAKREKSMKGLNHFGNLYLTGNEGWVLNEALIAETHQQSVWTPRGCSMNGDARRRAALHESDPRENMQARASPRSCTPQLWQLIATARHFWENRTHFVSS